MIWLYVSFGTYSKVYYTINTLILFNKPPTSAIPDLVTQCPFLKLKRRKNYAAEYKMWQKTEFMIWLYVAFGTNTLKFTIT